jgi:SAM-dependent methyltransferase
MHVNGNPFLAEPHLAAGQLTAAPRAGLEARRLPPAGTPSERLEAVALPEGRRLRSYARVLEHPPVAKPGPLAPLVRFLRRGLRALMRPWLEVQTRCNHQVIDALELLTARLNQTTARLEQVSTHKDLAVNKELGPTGRIAEAGLWFNPPVAVAIDNSAPKMLHITERIVEHIFVHTRLPRPPARVLDLGCAESTSAIEMASLGYEVVGVDLRDLPLRHPAFQMVHADVGNLPFPDNSFDVAVSLSTIEHVGLDWYGKAPEGTTDQRVIAEVKRVLRPGGRLILTVPFGRRAVTPVHRVYDRAMLDDLLAPLARLETAFALRDGEAWCFTTEGDRAEQVESTQRVGAVALIVAEKR